MWPYFLLVGAPAAVSLTENSYTKQRVNRLVIDLFFSIWIILLVFRHKTVGSDLSLYEWYFSACADMSWLDLLELEMEPGYLLMSNVLQFVGLGFRSAIVCAALAGIIPIWKLYRENCSEYAFLSIVTFLAIGLFGIYFSAIRQTMAIGFVLPVYKYTKEKKLLHVLGLVLCATLFHSSAIVLLLFYPVYYFKLRSLHGLLMLFPLFFLIYIFRVPIFTQAINLVVNVYGFSISETGAFTTLLLFGVILVYSFTVTKNSALDEDTNGLRNMLIVCIVIQIFSGINTLVMRINYYFMLFIPILIPRLIVHANEKNVRIAKFSVIVMASFFTVYYFYKAYTGLDYMNIYPYLAFWQ